MKNLTLFLILFLVSSFAFAQDLIILKTGEEIEAKVLEIQLEQIKYKRFVHQEGPTYSLAKSRVFLIKYENGMKEVLNTLSEPESEPKHEQPVIETRVPDHKVAHLTPAPRKPAPPRSRSWADNHYTLYGGLALTGGDFYAFGTGFHIGLENTRFFSNYFGLTGQVVTAYNGLSTYDPYYGDFRGGLFNTFMMAGIRGESNGEVLKVYGQALLGADWAVLTGDFTDVLDDRSGFHTAVGGSLGVAYRDMVDFGVRFNYAIEPAFYSLQISAGFRF